MDIKAHPRPFPEWRAEAGALDAWKLLRYDHGHLENPEMRKEIVAWLKRWL